MVGELAAIASALGWTLASVLIKPITWRLRSWSIHAAYVWATAIIALAAATLLERLTEAFAVPPFAAAFLVAGATLNTLGSLALIRAISAGNVGQALTVGTSVFVVLAIAGEWVILGQPLMPGSIAGAALILTGVAFNSAPEGPYAVTRRHPFTPLAALRSPNGLAAAAGVLWATGAVTWDRGLLHTDPIAAAALAYLSPAIFYTALAVARPSVRPVTNSRRDAVRLFIASCLYGGSVVGSLFAFKYAGAGLTSVLLSSTPLFAVPLGIAFARERASWNNIVGMLLCCAGVVLVFYPL